jgi:hypothetical protein
MNVRERVMPGGLTLALALAVACSRTGSNPPDERVEAAARAPSPPVTTDSANVAADAADTEEAGRARGDGGVDLAPYATARPVWGKSIGHTSVVFKLKLEGGAEAAYKPRTRRGKTRYRGEVAAYRLGRALGLTNVPPALPRAFPASELRAVLGDPASGAGKLFVDEVIVDERGDVRGAIIPWIPGLKFLPLDAEPSRSEWRGWLSASGALPAEERARPSEISTMLVFDYLTGNWDRWSGGNIGTDDSGHMLFIDNDGAFFDPPPPEPLAKQRALVQADHRFSKSFIAALRALEPQVVKEAMGEDAPGEALLSAKVLAGLEQRRKDVLAMVLEKTAKDGEDKVLSFE